MGELSVQSWCFKLRGLSREDRELGLLDLFNERQKILGFTFQ